MFNTAKTFKFTSQSDPDVPASSWCASVALLTLPLFPAHLNSALTTEPSFDLSIELQVISCTPVAAQLPCPCKLVFASKGTSAKSYPPTAVCPSWPLSCSEAALAILKLFSWGVSDEDTIPCRSECGSNELFDGIVFLPSAFTTEPRFDWSVELQVIPSCTLVAAPLPCPCLVLASKGPRMPPWAIVVASVE